MAGDCGRNRGRIPAGLGLGHAGRPLGPKRRQSEEGARGAPLSPPLSLLPVSYTHLTLPTILLV
eukprot:9495172-Pyramimonas_sp.AAC.1